MLHRKRVILTLTLVFLAVVVCAPGAFGQAVTQDVPIANQQVLNECNGELVDLSGTMHSETSFSTNPNGNTHFSLNAEVHMTGVGETTGVNYVANEHTHQEVNTKGMVAQEQSFSVKVKLVSQGPTPNMTDRATLHVVIDKNNNVKVDISKHQIKCN